MKEISKEDLRGLYRPPRDSHKGMNGRMLVIGGSRLFHASIFWTADVASRIVDLVHFSSPAAENNELVRKKAKEKFWNGIVVPWGRVESYIREDDCVVIGPGMPRADGLEPGERQTAEVVNEFLQKFPDRRWVIDGGAAQEMEPRLLNGNMIVTPHFGELKRLFFDSEGKIPNSHANGRAGKFKIPNNYQRSNDQIEDAGRALQETSKRYCGVTILLKGVKDIVCRGEECVVVPGGNPGMTKGGTGDVLAGLVGALYCKNDAFLSATAGSFINKQAGDRLYKRVGPYFNASDLVAEVPVVMKEVLGY